MDAEEIRLLVDAGRTREAAERRAHERWLVQQAEEETSIAGVLGSLASHGRAAVVTTETGTAHHGGVVAVGEDFCALATVGAHVFVPLRSIALIRPEPAAGTVAADPAPAVSGVSFAEALARLAADRPRVQLVLRGSGGRLQGVLEAVGTDALLLAHEGGATPGYVSLSALVEVSVRASG